MEYGYYKNGLLRTVTDPAYDARGNLTNTKRPNGTEELRTYDSAGRLAGLKDVRMKIPEEEEPPSGAEAYEILSEYTYAYDESGNITSIQGNNAADTPEDLSRLSSVEMAYDEENRLISYNGEALRYDADGNMTYGPVNGVMAELTYDCRNRLASASGMRYTYDAENNRMMAESEEYVEEFVTDTASSSLSRVLTVTLSRKDGEAVSAEEDTNGKGSAKADTAQNSGQTKMYPIK